MSYGTLNPHFNFTTYTPEQDLYNDLVDENIRMFGVECLFIPRGFVEIDSILGEPYQTLYNRFFPIPCINTNPVGDAPPDLMTQFGVQFQAEDEWFISKRIFRNLKIPERELRPFEGDLLLFGNYQSTAELPVFNNTLYEITYVQRDSPNWTLGRYSTWKLKTKMAVLSNEKFDTGNPHIDRANTQYSNESDLLQGINENLNIKKETLIDFDEKNPFGAF